MFREVIGVGGLEVQLVYFRGSDPAAECRASRWMASAERLSSVMSEIVCRAGITQIGRVLTHTRRENDRSKVAALVFIGDAMEENVDHLAGAASLLRNVRDARSLRLCGSGGRM
jgi:hypothetical protein